MSDRFSSIPVFEIVDLKPRKEPGEILEQGDRCPEFFFGSVDGAQYDLNCFLRTKFWIAFYRYAGCPICANHFTEVLSIERELKAAGIAFIPVFDCARDKIPQSILKLSESRPVAVSSDNQGLFHLFGVEKSWRKLISLGTIKARLEASRQGYSEQMVSGAFNRIPAHFLVEPGGTLYATHYGTHAGDHISFKKVWEFAKYEGKQDFELET